jgi:hypothetical protein
LDVGFERCEDKGEKNAPKFIPSSNYHKEEEALKTTKTHYPSNPKPSFNSKREVRKESPKPREEVFVCMFCVHAGHLDEFCFRRKRVEKRRFDYAIMMSSLIFRLVLTLVLHLVLLLVLCLISLMDLTIAHMILVHERIALYLDTLVMAHIFIMVIVPRVGPVFLHGGLTFTMSLDTWTVHIFSVVVHVPLVQRER